MNVIEKTMSALTPKAAKPSAAANAARKIANERAQLSEALAQNGVRLQSMESAYDVLERNVKSDENQRDSGHWRGQAAGAREAALEEKKAQLKSAGEALTPVYAERDELQAKLRELDAKMPSLAEGALRAMYPLAVELKNGIARLDEIEAKVTQEKAAIERDCDPTDEDELKKLESATIRLSVIGPKREREREKLAAQIAELQPLHAAATHELNRRLTAREEILRQRFLATITPLFPGGKLASEVENEAERLFGYTAARQELREIEIPSLGRYLAGGFALDAVPPLLSAFDSLAQIEAKA